MSRASCHLGRWRWLSGTWAVRRRWASWSHSLGKYSRQLIGQLAWSVAACTLTPTWQLATLPSAPQYCGATPTEWRPNFGKPVSSITHAAGAITVVIFLDGTATT